jgi:hypothetical protein
MALAWIINYDRFIVKATDITVVNYYCNMFTVRATDTVVNYYCNMFIVQATSHTFQSETTQSLSFWYLYQKHFTCVEYSQAE